MASTWIDPAEYPFESRFFDRGRKRLHYVDEGDGPPIVFVHGCPTWSFMYRYLIRGMRDKFRCLAMDNLGYGLSDKPTNATYRPERQAELLAEFIEDKGLRNLSLVAHGFGGPMALSYAAQHPGNVAHLVLMNTFMWPLADNPVAHKIDRQVNGPLGRFLYLSLNLPVRRMKHAIQDRKYFTKDIHEHYLAALDEPAERVAPYGYARALLGSSDWYQSLWEKRDALRSIPTLLLWGMKDPLFGHDALEKMMIAFPDAEVRRLAHAGHFVPEEKGPGLEPIVEMFLEDTTYAGSATLL